MREEHLAALRRAWRERRLVLFLGAGISAPYGLANWNDLVLDLLLSEVSKFDRFLPHYRKALALWLTEYSNFSPLALARVVRYKLEKRGSKEDVPTTQQRKNFMLRVRDILYRTYEPNPSGAQTALAAVARLIKQSEEEAAEGGRRIPFVLTTNFDNLLELELKKLSVKVEPVFAPTRRAHKGLRVLHVHGYLPKRNDGRGPNSDNDQIPDAELVFTEDEYHKLSYAVFHWALADIVSCFHNYTVLFVGQSLSDPNLRRLLDATHARGDGIAHYLLRKEYEMPAGTPGQVARKRAAGRIEEYAKDYAKQINAEWMSKSKLKTPKQLDEAIDIMLRQAGIYDRELFQDMGVGTIWLKDFKDIPLILAQIAAASGP